jgi:hypothetical protein
VSQIEDATVDMDPKLYAKEKPVPVLRASVDPETPQFSLGVLARSVIIRQRKVIQGS